MKGTKIKYLIILALAVFDLVALLAAFIFESYDIFLLLLLTNIILIALASMVFIFLSLYKGQAVNPEEYYRIILKELLELYKSNNEIPAEWKNRVVPELERRLRTLG